MSDLVARTGRHRQRYEGGYRLVAGCIPYRYVRADDKCNGDSKKLLEVLMITKQSGHGRIFPKGGWETDESEEAAALREALEEAGVRGDIKEIPGLWKFKSKSHQSQDSPEGLCRAKMFALHVTEELDSWPERNTRQRHWLSIEDACEQCKHEWMKGALEQFALIYRNSTSSEPVASGNTNCSSKLKD